MGEVDRSVDTAGFRSRVLRRRDRLVDFLNREIQDPIARRNEKDDRHLKLLIRFGLHPTANCLDVGANRGRFLRDIVRVAPVGFTCPLDQAAFIDGLETRWNWVAHE